MNPRNANTIWFEMQLHDLGSDDLGLSAETCEEQVPYRAL